MCSPDTFVSPSPDTFVSPTKAKDWKYEEEYRELVAIRDCQTSEGSYYTNSIVWYHGAKKQRVLKEVILGAHCTVCPTYIRKTLGQSEFKDVAVMKARLSADKFEVESENVP